MGREHHPKPIQRCNHYGANRNACCRRQVIPVFKHHVHKHAQHGCQDNAPREALMIKRSPLYVMPMQSANE